ncbi:MAG TPA: vanadium-dependent haloperoxidase [Glaciibacter sp.]|nr:vanadium-dependent haloperoxidase [Glaciibacter sp.]
MSMKSLRLIAVALLATAGVLTPAAAASAEAAPTVSADPAVITEWNAIAERTIFTENEKLVPESNLYFAFVSIAMYDAVVATEGRYSPYLDQPRARSDASPEVAAATAAFGVLRYYFPASASALWQDYRASLADAPKDAAFVHGIQAGAAAAATLIRARQDDGRGADVTFDVEPAPGVWRPTPPDFAPFALPWLGFVEPLVLESPILLDGPNPIDSVAYAKDFAETKAYGENDESQRSAEQTEIALFYSANIVAQYQAGMRDAVTRRGLDIVDSARSFAILNTSTADTIISCWRAKFDYPTWRPITAIQLADTDGNPLTEADPDWMPLGVNPPYSEYSSGHACVTGAASNTFAYLFGPDTMDLNLVSPVTSTTRHYDSSEALDVDTMNARIWLGIHFRDSMVDANALGHEVSDRIISTQFQPTNGD